MSIRQEARIAALVEENGRLGVGVYTLTRQLEAALADRDRWRTRATVLNDLRDPAKWEFVDDALREVDRIVEGTT